MNGKLNVRNEAIIDSEVRVDDFMVVGEVALNDMYSSQPELRRVTRGMGEISMEYKVRASSAF